jgi:hypothetical protein
MKKLLLMLLVISSQITVYSQDKKVSLNVEKKSIIVLFKSIQQQCGYSFIYSNEVVSDTMLVSLQVNKMPVNLVLDSVLSSKQLFHEWLAEGMIVIGSKKLQQKQGAEQARVSFIGAVSDKKNHPVSFATVSLLEDNIQVNGAIANEQGDFKFAHRLIVGKTYLLKITALGHESLTNKLSLSDYSLSVKDFGKLQLNQKEKQLKEVKVEAEQKLIEIDGGNIIFNVAKSITAQGLNALELMGRAPGVTVGTDNNISLHGKSSVAILIDGKQTYLSSREIAELLRSMSSSTIKSIEIISNPSAKYDASGTGGIINVKTIKSLAKGFNASITSGLSYGVYLRNNQDLAFSFRKNKVNIFGNYNHFIGNYSYLYGADRLQEGKFYNSFTDDVDKRNKMGSRLGADFMIDKKQTIGILLNGNFIFGGGITATRTEIGAAQSQQVDQVLTAINDYYQQKTQRYNVNLNYKYEDTLGRILNVDADYGDFTKRAGNLQSNKYTAANHSVLSDNLYRSLNGIDIGLKALKVDYTVLFWKGKLETGAKYSSVSANNDSKFLDIQPSGEFIDPTRTNNFTYVEKVASTYVNYAKNIKKWQFQGGLRLENASSKGTLENISPIAGNQQSTKRKYTNIFPFLAVSLKSSPSHNYSLSYGRRIDRPAYQNLNPFIYLLDELSFWQGNPFLEPQLSHRLQAQYVYKSATIVGLTYTYTDKFSVEVTDTVDKTRIMMVPRNLGVQQHLALTVTQMLNPKPWWSITFNGTVFHLFNDIDFGSGRMLKLKQTAGRLNLQQTFKLPGEFTAELIGSYNTKRLVGANQIIKPTSVIDIGLQRNFFNKSATLRLVASDIFKGSKASSLQQVGGLYIHNYSYFETRQFKINFSYRFASGNQKGPRSRVSALENENGRIK